MPRDTERKHVPVERVVGRPLPFISEKYGLLHQSLLTGEMGPGIDNQFSIVDASRCRRLNGKKQLKFFPFLSKYSNSPGF